jgi:small nuclear ribonucleoprotein (snRNP)-like protein
MFERTVALSFLACSLIAGSAWDESWKNLGHTIKKSTYTVALRDGRCVTGHVESVDDKYVTVGSLKLERKDVVRVGESTGRLEDHNPIYSGRSTWSDLQGSAPNKYERIQLELKNGTTSKCRNFSATEDTATCDGARIGKSEVARGYYIRLAPASEWEHYTLEEDASILAPRTWFDLAFFPRIKVLLYDYAVSQENARVECKLP